MFAIEEMEHFVKSSLLSISLLLAVGGASVAHASGTDLASVANAAEQMDPSLAVPAGVTLAELHRLYHPKQNSHMIIHYDIASWLRSGFIDEGVIGFVSSTPFEGGHAIRACLSHTPYDDFTSTDMNCEGQVIPPYRGIIGCLSTVQLPGTAPLYRCAYTWKGKLRHFDTRDIGCEGISGAHNDGPQGYVFM